MVQTTPEDRAAPLRLEAFALTAREREVAALIAQDLDTATIDQDRASGPAGTGTLTVDDGGALNLQGTAVITDGVPDEPFVLFQED